MIPEYYKSPVNNPRTDKTDVGMFGSSVLSIVYEISEIRTVAGGTLVRFLHPLKKRHDISARYRLEGTESWRAINTVNEAGGTLATNRYVVIDDITDTYVDIDYSDSLVPVSVEFELFFLDFIID